MTIDIEQQLSDVLLHIEKPGRYTGGEVGRKKLLTADTQVTVALCFPDLYEIGMSNNAVRILYDQINSIEGLYCDLVFCPAPDFAAVLKERSIPLYGLQSRKPINKFDILAFTVGYELAATNMLTILETSQIPFHAEDRRADDPVIIAGGPAVTNPVPFLRWIDGVFIGESEADGGLTTILKQLVEDNDKPLRERILSLLEESEHVSTSRHKTARSAVYESFVREGEKKRSYYVVPSISIVQEHGVVEIMRGCPNGCRFCHAGEFYKPYRQKDIDHIISQVEENLDQFGYREITLSSLSTGDYPRLSELIDVLNLKYTGRNISFSLPSLKVNTFTLPILKAVSNVRKSGLTFAIETPDLEWQQAMNKVAPVEMVSDIISAAKSEGWRVAKFYFMTGLPFTDISTEAEKITAYLKKIHDRTKINMNINIGTFVPKPHTPFQWAGQLDPDTALEHLKEIKRQLTSSIKGIKVNFHDPYVSLVEGMLSRGDERAGEAVEFAYAAGAKLDAWNEFFNWDLWKDAMDRAGLDVKSIICAERTLTDTLPWEQVTIGAGKGYLKREFQRASLGQQTAVCSPACDHLCGVCDFSSDDGQKVADAGDSNRAVYERLISELREQPQQKKPETAEYLHIIAEYEKTGSAVYLSHINIMKIVEAMFQRIDFDIEFTHGFNPKPRLEFMSPLPLGMSGGKELFMFRIPAHALSEVLSTDFIARVNAQLPEGINILRTGRKGRGHKSISSVYGGGFYEIAPRDPQYRSELNQILEHISAEHDHVHMRESSDEKIVVQVDEKQGAVSNILKLIDPIMAKYDFMSRYRIHRYMPYAPEGSPAFEYLTQDR